MNKMTDEARETEYKEIRKKVNDISEFIQKHVFELNSKTVDKWTDVKWYLTIYEERFIKKDPTI